MESNRLQEVRGSNNVMIGGDYVFHSFTAPAERPYTTFFYQTLVSSLVCSTLPGEAINLVSCWVVVICILSLLFLSRSHLLRPFFLLLFSLSILSGCAPLFAESDFEQQIRSVGLCGDDNLCSQGTDQGLYILGIAVDKADINAALVQGNIKDVRATSTVRGHGLISLARIDVYGEG